MADTTALLFAGLSIILAIVALGLVSGWASNNPGDKDTNWLGKPVWNHRTVFSWHPVLMVAGFFFSQIFTVTSWTFFPEAAPKAVFWFWQSAALATFISALCAVVNYKLQFKLDALTTVHSYVGVFAIVVFLFNFLWGFLADFSKSFAEKYGLKYDITYIHKALTIATLIFTLCAIVSGIESRLPTCEYLQDYDSADFNPAKRYQHLPNSCKVAYGVGISSVFATFFAVLAVTKSGFDPSSYKTVESKE